MIIKINTIKKATVKKIKKIMMGCKTKHLIMTPILILKKND